MTANHVFAFRLALSNVLFFPPVEIKTKTNHNSPLGIFRWHATNFKINKMPYDFELYCIQILTAKMTSRAAITPNIRYSLRVSAPPHRGPRIIARPVTDL